MTNTPSIHASDCKEYAQNALKFHCLETTHYLRMYG